VTLKSNAETTEGSIHSRDTLPEIDENLIRRDLTPAQRAKLVAKREAAYEAVHPETRQGASGRGCGKKGANFAAVSEATCPAT
jgi:hypothetical protein